MYFKPGVATPFDLLYYEADGQREGEGVHYVVRLLMLNEKRGVVLLEDARTSELVKRYEAHVDTGFGGGENGTCVP